MWFKASTNPDDGWPAPGALPAELAALGERLEADALRLGKTYPSCQPPLELMRALEQTAARRARVRAWVATVASAAALVLLMVGIYVVRNSQFDVVPAQSTEVNLGPVEVGPATIAHTPPPPALPAPLDATVQPVSYRPALADVNGPELEGLLDLLDEQPRSAAVISF
jgi:hypothetical protein